MKALYITTLRSSCKTAALRVLPPALLLLSMAGLAACGGIRSAPVPSLGLLACAFAAYASALAADPPSLPLTLGIALVARLMLLPLPASDDVLRYVWEGRALLDGVNPYVVAPGAATGVNHPGVGSIYPPVALAFEALGTWLGPSAFCQKLVFTGLDAGTVLLLLGIPAARDRVHAYAWNPLVVVAFAHEGHNDSLMIFLSVLAWWLVERGRLTTAGAALAGVALAGACLAKFAAIFFVPVFARRLGTRGMIALAVVLAGACAGLRESLPAFQTNLTYFGEMHFASSLYPVLSTALASVGEPGRAARAARWLLGAGAAAFALSRARRGSLPAGAAAASGVLLLCSPTVHPWYLTWSLPFAAAARSVWLLVWSATALLGYFPWEEVRRGQEWHEAGWISWAMYIPVLGALGWEVLRRVRASALPPIGAVGETSRTDEPERRPWERCS